MTATPSISSAPSRKSPSRIPTVLAVLLTACYLAVAIPLLMNHILWRDEAHAYVLVRDTHTLGELFAALRYFGHPPLWYLQLWAMKWFVASPAGMQWLHLAMAAATVFLVVRFAPFPMVFKVLFPFGYYALFEYGIISRNYQHLFLFSVLFCIVWGRWRRAFVVQGVLMALLCLSHLFGMMISAGIGGMIVYEMVSRPAYRRYARRHWKRFGTGCGIAVMGAVIALAVIAPPPNEEFLPDWRTDISLKRMGQSLEALGVAYFPLPPWEEHFWNQGLLPPWLMGVIGTAAAGAIVLCLFRTKRALLFFLISTLGILAFFYVKYLGQWRHQGILFVVAIAAIWMGWDDRRDGLMAGAWQRWRRWMLHGSLGAILLAQTYGAVVAVYFAWHYPFSTGRDAAAFLRRESPPGEVVVVQDDISVQAMAAYVPGRQFFLQRGSRWGTFTRWQSEFSKHDALTWAKRFSSERGEPVMLVLNEKRDLSGVGGTFLAGFDGGIVGNEGFYFYRIDARAGGSR